MFGPVKNIWILNKFKVYNKDIVPANIYLFKVNNRNTRRKVWNMFKAKNKNTRTMASFWYFLLLTLNIFHIFLLVFPFAGNQDILVSSLKTLSYLWLLLVVLKPYVAAEELLSDTTNSTSKLSQQVFTSSKTKMESQWNMLCVKQCLKYV